MLLVGVGPIIKIYSTPMSKQTNFPPADYKLTVSVQFLVCVVTVVVGIRGVEGQGGARGEDGHQDEVLEGLDKSSNRVRQKQGGELLLGLGQFAES